MTFIALFRKEVYAYFVSPLFYIVAAVFFALSGFFFYTQLIYFVQYGYGLNILANFWFAYVAGAPYSISLVLLLVMPLLTMRLIAEEKRLGTIELLLTYPIRDGTIQAAKFAACALVLAILLAGTLVYPAFLLSYSRCPGCRSLEAIWGCCCWGSASSPAACSSLRLLIARLLRRSPPSDSCSSSGR